MRYLEPERISLSAFFYKRPHTVSQWSAQVRAFWQLLFNEVPELGEPWQMRGIRDTELVNEDGSNIEMFMRRYGWNRKGPESYLPRPTGRVIAPNTTGYLPFILEFETLQKLYEQRCLLVVLSGVIDDKLGGQIRLRLPLSFLEREDLTELRSRAFELIVRFWQPAYMLVDPIWMRSAMGDRFEAEGRIEPMAHIAWQLYLNNSKVIDALGEDFEYEPYEQGVLIRTQREMPQVNDEVALERAFSLSRRLNQHGWVTAEQLRRDSVDFYPVPPNDSVVN